MQIIANSTFRGEEKPPVSAWEPDNENWTTAEKRYSDPFNSIQQNTGGNVRQDQFMKYRGVNGKKLF